MCIPTGERRERKDSLNDSLRCCNPNASLSSAWKSLRWLQPAWNQVLNFQWGSGGQGTKLNAAAVITETCTDFDLSEEECIQLFRHIFVHNSHKICLKHADYTRANLLRV